jgi:hypothetical protein
MNLGRSELRVSRIAFGERAEVDPSKSKPLHLAGRKHLSEGFAPRFEDRSAPEVRALIPSALGTAAAGQH